MLEKAVQCHVLYTWHWLYGWNVLRRDVLENAGEGGTMPCVVQLACHVFKRPLEGVRADYAVASVLLTWMVRHVLRRVDGVHMCVMTVSYVSNIPSTLDDGSDQRW